MTRIFIGETRFIFVPVAVEADRRFDLAAARRALKQAAELFAAKIRLVRGVDKRPTGAAEVREPETKPLQIPGPQAGGTSLETCGENPAAGHNRPKFLKSIRSRSAD